MKICLGIISYLPDDPGLRDIRISRLENLLIQCDNWFQLPIIIVAQNWKDDINLETKNSKIILYKYSDKLGITKARETLREKFISSEFDRMISIDDDMVLSSHENVRKYINAILGPEDFFFVDKWILNFSCISKFGAKSIPFDTNVNPEEGTGFEDWLYFRKCKRYLRSKRLIIPVGKGVRADYLNDKYSTWDDLDVNKKNINNSKTNDILKQLKI